MLHHRPWVAGLVAILATLVLAPTTLAASPSAKAPAGAKAKERAYGKHCGRKEGKAGARAKCLEAMAKLASGESASPKKACRGLSKKRVHGERKSAFARCVREGRKLLKANKRAAGKNGNAEADAEAEAESDEPSRDSGDAVQDPDVGDDPDLELGIDDDEPDA